MVKCVRTPKGSPSPLLLLLALSCMEASLEEITEVLGRQNGVLFASRAVVHRAMYSGRGIIAPNTKFSADLVDGRGYLPVEWWIMSKTEAKNAVTQANEGVTSLLINTKQVLLTSALEVAEHELMGNYAHLWPLTKILDIGGSDRTPKYTSRVMKGSQDESQPEAPPIPCHVHAGEVVDGRCKGQGKTEAYFFPPVDVPPYCMNLANTGVKTRLGLKAGVTRDQVLSSLSEFGQSDDLYSLLNEYAITPWESWTIEEKIVHAPGPWPTFEIQLPQDDFHLLAWVLGITVPHTKLSQLRQDYHLRGLASDQQLLDEAIDWRENTDPGFREKWWRSCEVLQEGDWGRLVRLFYHIFYGEGLVLEPGHSFTRQADDRPYAGIVWSGGGTLNSLPLDCSDDRHREFLVTPHHQAIFTNTSQQHKLLIFTVFPFQMHKQRK